MFVDNSFGTTNTSEDISLAGGKSAESTKQPEKNEMLFVMEAGSAKFTPSNKKGKYILNINYLQILMFLLIFS